MVTTCPVCGDGLSVGVLRCSGCESELRGEFSLPRLARLPRELQDVVEVFLRCRGNIKEVERELGISYPTVSKKLDAINLLLASMGAGDSARARILRRLEAGELTVAEAVKLLKEEAPANRRRPGE
jgi:hypothetical protein